MVFTTPAFKLNGGKTAATLIASTDSGGLNMLHHPNNVYIFPIANAINLCLLSSVKKMVN
jgi:hypothetical protein